jgi:hypothetical protein
MSCHVHVAVIGVDDALSTHTTRCFFIYNKKKHDSDQRRKIIVISGNLRRNKGRDDSKSFPG